ncbi:hypothetical protein KF840_24430 [bacterium]|nr:hypothetical protein [bacterium]
MLLALIVALHGSAALAVRLGISSANVSQPGGAAQMCVSLATEGQEVAGTQNDLVWDGTCMTLNEGACFAAGTHGKQVNTRIQNSADFRMRVLVLSLSDVDPIDDGVLYCCNVQGEAPPGSCCSISVVNTGASDSKGQAVAAGGNSGNLCTLGGSGSRGGAVGSVTGAGGQMGMNSGAGSGGSMAGMGGGEGAGGTIGGSAGSLGGSGGSVGGAGAQAPPASQVLQGGGGGAAPGAAGANPAAPIVQVPGGSVAQVPTPVAAPTFEARQPPPTSAAPAQPALQAEPAATAAAGEPGAAPVTEAPTSAPTPADTFTVAVPTPVPPTEAPPSTPTAPPATPTAKRGWFGCQIGSDASAAPALALALLFGALAHVRRRRVPHR